MKFYKPPTYQFLGFVIGMPFIGWAINSIMYGGRIYQDHRVWTIAFPLLCVAGFISWNLHYQYTECIRRRFPLLNQTRKRIVFIVLTFILVMSPAVLLIFLAFDHFAILDYQLSYYDIKMGVLVGFIVDIVFEALWEVIYIINKYKENLAENAMLEQMSISLEFENLKGQVNPHFLF